MQFGLLYEAQRPFSGTTVDWNALYKETLEQCVAAEKAGFDNLWFVEHHFLTGFSGSPCPEVLLGALSQLTKRIRIGFGVCILPYHHPVRVAERAAMLDQLTDGRLEFGTGRSNAYEQIGQGIDPRDTRAMWEESITMLPRIWQSDEFSWEGKFWTVPTRRVLPKPFQKPHPRLYLACTQTESFDVAAEKGIGVLSSATYATTILAEHVKRYRGRVTQSTPVGATVNEFWGNNVHAFCGPNNREARELAARSLKTFFGPDKPYIRDRVNAYEQLLESWGGVPDHLKADFGRWLRQSDEAHRAQAAQVGISLDSGPGAARAAFGQMDPDTLCDRGIIIAGDPDSCIKGVQLYEEAGVDQVILITQTETIPHAAARSPPSRCSAGTSSRRAAEPRRSPSWPGCKEEESMATAVTELKGTEADVLRADDRRFEAMRRGDWAGLDAALADDLTYVHSTARLETKAEHIDNLRGGKPHYRGIAPARAEGARPRRRRRGQRRVGDARGAGRQGAALHRPLSRRLREVRRAVADDRLAVHADWTRGAGPCRCW